MIYLYKNNFVLICHKEVNIMSEKVQLGHDITIHNRFRQMVDRSGLTREKFAKILQCDTSTMTKKYNGDRNISVKDLLILSNEFNVSTDYLLGLSNIESRNLDVIQCVEAMGLDENIVDFIVKLNNDDSTDLISKKCFIEFVNKLLSFCCENYKLIITYNYLDNELRNRIDTIGNENYEKINKLFFNSYSIYDIRKYQVLQKRLSDKFGDYLNDNIVNKFIDNSNDDFIDKLIESIGDIDAE